MKKLRAALALLLIAIFADGLAAQTAGGSEAVALQASDLSAGTGAQSDASHQHAELGRDLPMAGRELFE